MNVLNKSYFYGKFFIVSNGCIYIIGKKFTVNILVY